MKDLLKSRKQCPHCHSDNVVPISTKTFICTGAGGLVGGVAAALACKDEVDGISAGPVVAGAITGAMAGLSVGKAIQKDESGKPCICLDCYRTFTSIAGVQYQNCAEGGEGMENRADNE